MKRIAIVGGIGSGKSVVSRILRTMEFPVYDCDSRAKFLMNDSSELQKHLVAAFGAEVFSEGRLNTKYLSAEVFGNTENLQRLNAIVHPAVRHDFCQWADGQTADLVFVETAIPKESGIEELVDCVWLVSAPEEVRIKRVEERNGIDRRSVVARIKAQTPYQNGGKPSFEIINDGKVLVLPQVSKFVKLCLGK